jgi:molecular chaperone DnaK (HSP70)
VAFGSRRVLRQSVGIETRGGKFAKLIERGSALPATRSEVFTTSDDGQASIRINVFRGDHDQTAFNTSLGVFEVSVLAPGPPGQPQVEITFTIDARDHLTVSARDLGTGAELPAGRI